LPVSDATWELTVSEDCIIALATTTIHTSTIRATPAGVALVRVTGQVDHASGDPLRAILAAQLDRRPTGLVVDLTGTVFFSAAGINALLDAAARARVRGAGMVVVTERPIILRALRLTGADRELHLRPTLDSALVAPAAQSATADRNTSPPVLTTCSSAPSGSTDRGVT
jgi:anti-sigma B factor antagonist